MPLIDPELLPFVDEVRAENAAMAERAKESFGQLRPAGRRDRADAGDDGSGWRIRPAARRTWPRNARSPGPRATSRSVCSCRRRSTPSTSRSTVARSCMGSRRSSDQVNWRIAQECNVGRREPRVPHGAGAPVPRRVTTTARRSRSGCSSTAPTELGRPRPAPRRRRERRRAHRRRHRAAPARPPRRGRPPVRAPT